MRLKFVEPLLPTLVDKPPEGDEWIHEIKFDGYRSQIIIDHDVRTFTRNGRCGLLRPVAQELASHPKGEAAPR